MRISLTNILLLILAIYNCPLINAYAQKKEKNSTKSITQLEFRPGISIQTFAFQRWISYPSSYLVQASSLESNAEGYGLTLPLYLHTEKSIGILINPILRYDFVRSVPYTISGIDKNSKYALFADLHLSIYQSYRLRIGPNKMLLKVGLGYSFISPFQGYKETFTILITPPYTPKLIRRDNIKLDFEGFHFFLNLPITNEISLKQQLIYVPKGQILYKGYWEAMMYHLCIEIDPKVFKRKNKSD
jgi:hypothetical protein